ncbi:hypothetical protein NQ314_011988 [Rhamnusium bicolor]|uniref:Uncharacterized protein n=1 Tax=Rhamnusium bicolor TaxID=1586634 RepID=A0AAV8XE15_9CUCU|nr:hypothetical protein NQ314_011988 [Rhamnusium bicolor]
MLGEIDKVGHKSLSAYLIPEKYDIVVQATKQLCESIKSDNTKRPEFGISSLALKIGYALRKCVSIERGTALRPGNIKINESLLSFLHLMDMEWSIRISSNALSSLYKRKINSTHLLPITNDLVKLTSYIDNCISQTKAMLLKNRNNSNWTHLATLTLARIILFNKRRSGEASRLKMSDYISRPSWKEQNTQEIIESLTPIEKETGRKFSFGGNRRQKRQKGANDSNT